MGTGRTRGGRLPSEVFTGSWRDPPPAPVLARINTAHTASWGGVSLSSTTQTYVCGPTCPQKRKGRNGSGSPLLACSPVTCVRPGCDEGHCAWPRLLGSCMRASRGQTYKAALLRDFGVETYSQELCPGSSRKRCCAVSACAYELVECPSKRRWLMLYCRVIGPQLLILFLNSLPFTPPGSDCLTREVESGVPGPSFLKVIKVEMSNCPVLHLRHKPSPWAACGLGLSVPCSILCRSTTCTQQSHWEENTVCCCHNHSVLAPAHTAWWCTTENKM